MKKTKAMTKCWSADEFQERSSLRIHMELRFNEGKLIFAWKMGKTGAHREAVLGTKQLETCHRALASGVSVTPSCHSALLLTPPL